MTPTATVSPLRPQGRGDLRRPTATAADGDGQGRVEQVIASRFERFAHREGLQATLPEDGS
jgi:hypothetical protein